MATPQQLIDGWQSATNQIRARVLAYALAVWGSSAAYRDEDVAKIIARIVPVIQSGQMQVANLTDAYIGQMASALGVAWSAGVARDEVLGYRGTPVAEVYKRPAVTLYTALSKGTPYLDALELGRTRLESLVTTDLQQARNRQATASISKSGFTLFRRVLSGAENCALCAIASTNLYSRGDLMPIHSHCDCGVVPVGKGAKPSVPDALVKQSHQLISARTGSTADKPLAEYADLVTVNLHGELGPTLGWASDHFTGPNDLH